MATKIIAEEYRNYLKEIGGYKGFVQRFWRILEKNYSTQSWEDVFSGVSILLLSKNDENNPKHALESSIHSYAYSVLKYFIINLYRKEKTFRKRFEFANEEDIVKTPTSLEVWEPEPHQKLWEQKRKVELKKILREKIQELSPALRNPATYYLKTGSIPKNNHTAYYRMLKKLKQNKELTKVYLAYR